MLTTHNTLPDDAITIKFSASWAIVVTLYLGGAILMGLVFAG